MPKISVIVPIYKVEKYLCRCIDSILNQTFTDFELVLVDDGSPDNCGKICDEYAQKDDKIIVIHQENGGLSAARNSGLDWVFENSDSEWVSFIDSDDWIHCQYLELLYFSAVKSGLKLSVCNFKITEKYTEDKKTFDEKYEIFNPEDFYCSNVTVATVSYCKLYKKDFFKNLRFPVGCIHEDELTTYKIMFQEKAICYIDFPLYMYFKNENGIMHTPNYSARIKAYPLLKKRHQFFKNNGFKNAYRKSKESELKLLYHLYKDADSTSGYEKEKNYVTNKMRLFLLRNYKQFPIKVKPHIYSMVFKCITKLYWYKEAAIKKLKDFFTKA